MSLLLVLFAANTVFHPYPIEYREGATQVVTQLLLEGKNPFELQSLPVSMTNYGMEYNLLILPLAAVFGNTLVVHRVVSNLFIFLSCALCFAAMVKANRSTPISLAGACLIAICLMSYAGNGAFPNSAGTFLFLLAILVASAGGFSNRSLLASSLVCVLAFYAKPYFVLAFGIVLLYLLLVVSLKKAFLFAASFMVLFVISASLVLPIFPTYFLETVFSNMSNSMLSWIHLLRQVIELVINLLPLLAFAILLFIRNRANGSSLADRVHAAVRSSSWSYHGFVAVCSLIAVTFVLGRHVGSYMSYFYQLAVPLGIVWLFRYLKASNPYPGPMAAALLLNMGVLFCTNLVPGVLSPRTHEWERLYASVGDSRLVFNSPVLVSRQIDLGIPVTDSGQSEYFYWIKPYPSIGMAPNFADVQSRGKEYLEAIENAVRNMEYEKIYLTQGFSNIVSTELVSQYYTLSDSFYIQMPQAKQTWTVQLWLP